MSDSVVIIMLSSFSILLVVLVAGVAIWSDNQSTSAGGTGSGVPTTNGDGGPITLTKYWVPIDGLMDMGEWTDAQGGNYKEERKLNAGTKNKQMYLFKNGGCSGAKANGPRVDYHMFTKCNEEGTCVVGGQLYNLCTAAQLPLSDPPR